MFGALTIVVVWKATEELKGNLFAMILAATAVTFSAILRLNMLYQPNSFNALCWTFLYFVVIKYINTNHNKWLWIAAIAFGVGFLNKYNIIFAVLGLLPAVLLTHQRKIFANKHFDFAVGFSILRYPYPNLGMLVCFANSIKGNLPQKHRKSTEKK